jgi:hypothetical protein
MGSRNLNLRSGENNLPTRLETWLLSGRQARRDLDSLNISFGEDDSFFAIDKDGFCWANLPPLLEDLLQASISRVGNQPPR